MGYHIFPTNLLWEFFYCFTWKVENPYTDEEIDFQVRRFIGIYNGIFWVFLNAEGFIGLDIETGELKYRYPLNITKL